MKMIIDEIKQLKEKLLEEISQISNLLSLENLERKFLGRRGLLREILKKINQLPEEKKPEVGRVINQIKIELKQIIEKKKLEIENKKIKIEEGFDVSLPAKKIQYGHLHPSTQLKNEVIEIFQSMGFEIVEGPEVDNEWYNFEVLNIPSHHPARDMWDTFYLTTNKEKITNNKLLLRTHTSNMQVRVMEKRKPPLKICVIGKCFRHEATDATHEHTIYQIEGFVVDEKISLANLIYTLKTFLNALYKKEVKIRIKPSYFPFVEPGIEVDMACEKCQISLNNSCPICHGSGWIEILGAGMIHPKVFEFAGYPKDKYTGFAFGIGFDRLVMMHHKIDDIRWLQSGDLRFIRQF